MDKLTPKQELFVQGIIAGLSQRQAYRKAFPNSEKWKNSAVDSAASRLLQNSKVLARYRVLLKQFSNMSLWSREQAFNEYEWLKNKAKASIDQEGVRQANSNAFLAALDGMNNMAFHDLELEDRKLLLEIEKLASQVGESEGQDEKIADFIDMLKGAIIDED